MGSVITILVCLQSTPIDACTTKTAIDFREVAAPALLPMQCAMAGLSTVAADPRGSDGLYVKIICGRPAITARK